MRTKNKTGWLKKLFRIAIFVSAVWFVILLVGLILVYAYKDDLANSLLSTLNKNRSGAFYFTEVTVNPFVHFPEISLEIDSAFIYENKANRDRKPIVSVGEFYVSINFVDLFTGKINVSKITLKHANIFIDKLPDGSFNLTNALHSTKINDSSESKLSKEISEEFDEARKDIEFSLKAKYISFQDIQLHFNEVAENLTSSIEIEKLSSSLSYTDSLVHLKLTSDIQIVDFLVNKNFHLRDDHLEINTALSYDLNGSLLSIAPSRLVLNEGFFDVKGTIKFGENDFVDLIVDGSVDDISFLKPIITSTAIQSIEHGDFHFSGKIVGSYTSGLPDFIFHFGFNDLKMRIPQSSGYIDRARLNGYFHSGNKRDFSMAELRIEPLTAELPGGKILANIKVSNFVKPDVDLSVEMKADISGMEKIFKISLIDSLQGNVKIDSHIKGLFDPELPESFVGISTSAIVLDSVSFTIPEIMNVDLLDGEIAMQADSLFMKNLLFKTGKTDLALNGFVHNAIYLLFNHDKEITSGLKIVGPAYDFPQFFAYNPDIWKGFPYVFENIDLDVFITTSTFKLLHATLTPEIEFDIKHLNATVVDFLAPIKISRGVFNMGDQANALLLSFKDFQLEMAGAEIHTELEYYANNADSSSMDVQLQMVQLNPAAVIYNQDKQKPSEFLEGMLNGSVKLFLDLSKDTANFKMIDFFSPDLTYIMSKDTIDISNFHIKGSNISYESGYNPLSTFSAKSQIMVEEFKMNKMNVHHIEMDLTAAKGVFDIDLNKINLLDEEGKGHLILDPFSDNPTYQLSYSISQFDVESMIAHFMESTLISGKADFNANLTMHGNNWDSTLSNLDGVINFYSKDMTVHGYDIDRLIAKIKKTQNFDLIDVGAMLLAGPFGLAITKGSEYTSLFINRSDATSVIHEFKSDWYIKHGVMFSKDVAFATYENRIAGAGKLNIVSDSIQFTVALLNKRGCAEMTQSLHGSLSRPKINNLKVAQNIIQPVINLAKEPAKLFCKPFYRGTVAQPEKREEKEEDSKHE